MLKTNERIISTEDLAQQAATAVANAQQEPLIVTSEGRPAAYLISVELYDALREHLHELEQSELLAGIKMGEAQFGRGQFKTLDEAAALAESIWSQRG